MECYTVFWIPIIDDSSYEDFVYKCMYKLVCLLYAVVSNLPLTIPRMRKYNEKKSSLYISQYIQTELLAISTPDKLIIFQEPSPWKIWLPSTYN